MMLAILIYILSWFVIPIIVMCPPLIIIGLIVALILAEYGDNGTV